MNAPESPTKEESSDPPPEDQLDPVVAELLESCKIVIRPGGEVVIEHLSENLVGVAEALDPFSDSLSCRLDSMPDEG